MANIIQKADELKSRELDSGEKNKFRFDWLEKYIEIDSGNKIKVGDVIKKVDLSGKVVCDLCTDFIYYGTKGFSAISQHLKSKKHKEKERLKKCNYSLPANFFKGVSTNNFSSDVLNSIPSSSTTVPVPYNVPLCDRVLNQESMLLGFMAYHNLSFKLAPELIEFCKTMAADKKALSRVSMSRTAASYKVNYGLAKTFFNETVNNLKDVKFSLNIDEATSNNYKKVVCVLVSYFSTGLNQVVIEHLDSFSVTKVSSQNLFDHVSSLFKKNEIPWNNLVSVLMDSCNVMRGSKAGLEIRLREKAPHLLDIDGDSCHHIHNASKIFCKSFTNKLEKLYCDIYYDFKYSTEFKEILEKICLILGIKYTSIDNMVAFRWLSIYDVSLNTFRIQDALVVFYTAFLSSRDKIIFEELSLIYAKRNVNAAGKAKIKEFHKYLSAKQMTKLGKARKERIIGKLFHEKKMTGLVMNFFIAVLPLLKNYICTFQMKQPLIHKLYDEQERLFLEFLSCFLKAEILKDKPLKEILSIDIGLDSNRVKGIFVGTNAESVINKTPKDAIVKQFLQQANSAYTNCAEYLIKKLPFNNKLLKCASAIDPLARGHSITLTRLKKLPKLLSNILNEEEEDKYSLEVYKFQVDKSLPHPLDASNEPLSLSIWWSQVFLLDTYPNLTKIVKALLSIFHGPQVESSFSMMSNIIDDRSGNLKIKTVSSIQTIKYKLLSLNKSPTAYFKKNDFLHDSVDKKLCVNMRNAYTNYKKDIEHKLNPDTSSSEKPNIATKAQSLKEIKEKERQAMLKRKNKLLELVKKKRAKR